MLLTASKLHANNNAVTFLPYKIIKQLPHNPVFFTQGLVYQNGVLYESTGLYGQSSLYQYLIDEQLNIVNKVRLPANLFGEGITLFTDKIYQLTYKAGIARVYKADSLQYLTQYHYQGEGWGLTSNHNDLIMSNGSNRIVFIKPNTFEHIKTLSVVYRSKPVNYLNELEFVNGYIFANIWYQDQIAVINSKNGNVLAWVDIAGLRKHMPATVTGVANGIAYADTSNVFYITGKNWPSMFILKIDLSGI